MATCNGIRCHKTRIVRIRAKSLELYLLVRSGTFFLFFTALCIKLGMRGVSFRVIPPSYPGGGNFSRLGAGTI